MAALTAQNKPRASAWRGRSDRRRNLPAMRVLRPSCQHGGDRSWPWFNRSWPWL